MPNLGVWTDFLLIIASFYLSRRWMAAEGGILVAKVINSGSN